MKSMTQSRTILMGFSKREGEFVRTAGKAMERILLVMADHADRLIGIALKQAESNMHKKQFF